jgi:hypothetical protein
MERVAPGTNQLDEKRPAFVLRRIGERESAMRVRHLCGIAVGLLVLSAAFVHAQDTASLTGTVRDSSGASVVNAQVAVTSTERGINRTTTTNSDGEYSAPALPAPASYNVTVTSQGFKKFQARGVILRVAQKSRVDVTLEVGAATTEVTVLGSTVAQVETQSSDLAGTVSGKEITQLQLNGRNFTQLVTLVPGVSNQTGADEAGVGITGSVAYSMNGGRIEYNNWELDGGDNMDNGSNGSLNVYPSLEAIAEFKVLTSNYGAQYGRNGSGTVEPSPGRVPSTATYTSSSATTFSMPAITLSLRSRPTRRMISATPSAVRFTFPASTTKASRRPSSSGPRNGVANAYPPPSIPRYRTARNVPVISAICVQRPAPSFCALRIPTIPTFRFSPTAQPQGRVRVPAPWSVFRIIKSRSIRLPRRFFL